MSMINKIDATNKKINSKEINSERNKNRKQIEKI